MLIIGIVQSIAYVMLYISLTKNISLSTTSKNSQKHLKEGLSSDLDCELPTS